MKQKNSDLTQGSIGWKLLLFALPLLGSSLIQQLYNTVDLMFVGNLLGKGASAAVGTCGWPINCLVGFFTGMGVGVGVLVSQACGAKDSQKVKQIIHTTMGLVLAGSVILMVIGMTLAPVILRKMNTPEDILELARQKGEPPFVFILDGIEDPHNLGAIIRTANLCGAHGVIIPKRRAVGLTPTVAKTSAGAIHYTPVAKVTNITSTIKELKGQGMWFVCADMGGTAMYDLNLTGPIGLVIGNEGEGVSKLVRENCDMIASIPMKGDIDSLNASVAAGVLAYEIVRQRLGK